MAARLQLGSTPALYDEDLGPQLVSWAISIAAAAAWLALVHFTPLPLPRVDVPLPDGIVTYTQPAVSLSLPRGESPTHATHKNQGPAHTAAAGLSVAGIFAATVAERAVAEVAHLIPGVQAVQGESSGRQTTGEKSALSTAANGSTPGMSKFNTGGAGASYGSHVGDVQRGGSIEHAEARVGALPVVTAPLIGGAATDVVELGSFVRAHVSQLQSCYERSGGTDLAGVVALRLTLGSGGMVRSAEIVRRTWSGPGAAEAEACLLTLARGWRIPSAAEGATVTLPISFTRGT
jgi:hypothetical protein